MTYPSHFTGMLCNICKAFTQRDGVVWATVPCVIIFKESLHKHSRSDLHANASTHENHRRQGERDGGVASALQQQVNMQRTALAGAINALYFLVKCHDAHTTQFEPLIELLKQRGAAYMDALYVVSGRMWCHNCRKCTLHT